MTKLEAWKTWSASAGAPGTEFTLEKSSHGKAFSYAWDAALAQPEPEPVLWEIWPRMGGSPYYSHKKPADTDYVEFTPLYAAPPQRKPLTEEEEEEEIAELAMDKDGLPNSHLEFARAIERAHGIGGQE